MKSTGTIAAVILAAGRASRMGRSKALLPVGGSPVLERVVESVVRAGVDDVVVVTGHRLEGLVPLLDGLPVRQAHNADYDAGMFSSVKTGVRAVGDQVEAFFVLPVDYPLVRTEVIERLVAAFRETHGGILHPTCCGRRGHPTLIAARYRDALVAEDTGSDLRSFLRREAAGAAEAAGEVEPADGAGVEVEVEVEDATILMDMDTEEDYRRVCRFAAAIDAAAGRGAARPAIDAALGTGAPAEEQAAPGNSAAGGAAGPAGLDALAFEDALFLLSVCDPPASVVSHCHAVAAVGEALARAVEPQVPHLDVALVRAAGLLHDMARTRAKHALAGRRILENLGLCRLGAVVGAHMVLPPEQVESPLVTEEQLVYLADKLVVDDAVGSLADRAARMMREWGPGPVPTEALEGMERRMRAAAAVQKKVEALLGRPLDEVLPRETPSSI